MADPPPYEESASSSFHSSTVDKHASNGKLPTRLSIHEELGVGRAQRVASLVSELLPQVRARARQGFSKSLFLLLPLSKQNERKGTLVGYSEHELPIVVELEGDHSAVEFWTQETALSLLTSQLQDAIADNIPAELPARPAAVAVQQKPPVVKKSSFWGKKAAPLVPVAEPVGPVRPLVVVVVQPDEASFRSETDYGLFETLRARCVSVAIDIR